MSAQHTPGPWRARKSVEPGESVEWEVVRDIDDGQLVVSLTYGGTGPEGHEENAADNARLIAAAPEHHEASRSTVERLADLPRFLREENNSALAEIVEEELGKHRAAIAKATGSPT